jgi:hypothetical protein
MSRKQQQTGASSELSGNPPVRDRKAPGRATQRKAVGSHPYADIAPAPGHRPARSLRVLPLAARAARHPEPVLPGGTPSSGSLPAACGAGPPLARGGRWQGAAPWQWAGAACPG